MIKLNIGDGQELHIEREHLEAALQAMIAEKAQEAKALDPMFRTVIKTGVDFFCHKEGIKIPKDVDKIEYAGALAAHMALNMLEGMETPLEVPGARVVAVAAAGEASVAE